MDTLLHVCSSQFGGTTEGHVCVIWLEYPVTGWKTVRSQEASEGPLLLGSLALLDAE